ncbi:hypothetical protein BC826DRAFT_969062 [Russula brevipes]|nr:hypothetical protein BC826DRAFT_969062 [Russula brevipes]
MPVWVFLYFMRMLLCVCTVCRNTCNQPKMIIGSLNGILDGVLHTLRATATVCVGQRGIVQWLRKRISGGQNSTPGPHGARGQATTPNRKLDEPLWDMFGKLRIKCGSGYGEKGAQGVGEEGGRLGGNARGRRKKYCNVGADRAVANPSHSSALQREAPENPASIKWGGIHDNKGRTEKGVNEDEDEGSGEGHDKKSMAKIRGE